MFYIVKTPGWLKFLFRRSIWEITSPQRSIYLTFDDGPHPEITGFVLDELKKYDAKATFFCIGINVLENPLIYKRILNEGHSVGNHTYNHLNGWKTKSAEYLHNVSEAAKYINSNLFRPPYGRITQRQQRLVQQMDKPFKVVMWSVLSGDFDTQVTPEKCCENVLKNADNGSIVVFHDSEKAFERLKYTLPRALKYFSEKGYRFEKIASG